MDKVKNVDLKSLNWKKIGIIAGSIVGGLLLIYIIFSVYFMSHFFFRSTVNGVPSSGKSASGMVDKIKEAAKDYSLDVIDEDGTDIKIASNDIDMNIDVTEDKLSELFKEQNGFAWVKYIFTDKDYVSPAIISLNNEKLNNKLTSLKCLTRETTTPTENAKVVFNGNEFVIEPEKYGNTVEINDLTNKVTMAIYKFQPVFDVAKEGYLLPAVLSTDPTLNKSLANLNKVKDIKITYETGNEPYTIPKDTIATFFGSDNMGEIIYNEDAILGFVKEMAGKYNTAGKAKNLHTSYGADVTVSGGDYGWKIDNAGEKNQLIEDLKEGKDVKREFVYKQKAASHGANDYGDSYIEINLTAQHMFLHKNGSVVLESDIVSGNPYKGNATPTGAYGIYYCDKDAILRGEGYETPVAYWMPFNGGVGLHDATWQSSFGGQRYKFNGSHGCINLPLNVAASVFSQVSSGFPVLVYSLGGTEQVDMEIEMAKGIVTAINNIGPVDPSKAEMIASVRAQYEALPGAAKQVVTNLNVLEAAEAELAAQLSGQAPPPPEQPAA
ncbi:MAG TPA: hypothetical protein DCR12_05435 [Lachnospiraceae bacterium]|nr:hypothetical protein [Lachnospiraceae bacterium]